LSETVINTLSDDPDTQSNSSFFNNSAPKISTVYLGDGNAEIGYFEKYFQIKTSAGTHSS
jgi:hypothetical protein